MINRLFVRQLGEKLPPGCRAFFEKKRQIWQRVGSILRMISARNKKYENIDKKIQIFCNLCVQLQRKRVIIYAGY